MTNARTTSVRISQAWQAERSFAAAALAALLILAFAALPAPARADHHEKGEAEAVPMIMRYREGEHYQRLPTGAAKASEQIEVVEYFSYGCIHCFNFDPFVKAWSAKLDDDVSFKHVPAVFNRSWEFLAQAYYTAEVLGVSEAMHQPLFDAIHTNNINIGDPALMTKLFQDHGGVSADDFAQAFESFSVRSKVQQAKAEGRALRLRAVPSMVVGGQYVVDGSMAGGNAEMLDVVDYLVGLLESERNLIEAATGD